MVIGQNANQAEDLLACRIKAATSEGVRGGWSEYLTLWGSALERCLIEEHGWDSTDAAGRTVLEVDELRRIHSPVPDSAGVRC